MFIKTINNNILNLKYITSFALYKYEATGRAEIVAYIYRNSGCSIIWCGSIEDADSVFSRLQTQLTVNNESVLSVAD